ncbi:TonB-dependent receptor [gamma proteobacterium NOR5-3]|nr:TonB-dependent receptor [gamma proteobacterium NOR5-3]
MRYDDYQVFQFLESASGATSLQLTNAGKVSVTGVETELTWVPTQNLRFVANGTWIDAVYDEFENPGDGEAFSGNSLPYAPELKYFLAAQYLLQLAGGSISFDVDYTWVDDQFTDPANLEVDQIESYSLLGARAAYTPSAGNWELALWGRNLTDEEFTKVNNDNFLGTPRTVWGDPQLYGATFTYFLGR